MSKNPPPILKQTPSVHWLNNPFNVMDVDRFEVDRPQTIRQWLDDNGGDTRLNRRPTVCLYRGKELMRSDYAHTMIDAPVCFVTLPQGGDGGSNPLAIVATIALMVVAPYAAPALAGTMGITGAVGVGIVQAGIMIAGGMLINSMMPTPDMPNSSIGSSGSPTYDIAAQGNQARLNQPIPVNYGRLRIYPDFAAQPYTEYHSNEQYLYQLFCIGQGINELSDIRFEDTPIANYPEVSYQIVKPHEKVTLFPSAVVTAAEAGGQGMNEPVTHGPYIINDIGTEISRIGVDIVFPGGLIGMTDEGDEYSVSVHIRVTAESVNDAGEQIGQTIVIHDGAITDRTRTPKRVTVSADVEPARYRVTVQRTTGQGSSYQVMNAQLGAIRGYMVSENEYGDVTLLAMRVRASESLSNSASRLINCVAERLVPKYVDGTGWTDPQVTRNPVWAFCDAVRARYGGDFADSVFEYGELLTLANTYESRGDDFNGRFDTDSNLWEALTKITQTGRAMPVRHGNRIRMIRDQRQTVPSAMFSMANVSNLSMDFIMHNDRTADSVKVIYWDQDKDYKQQSVLCTLPDDTGNNPEEVTMFGVTSRDQAWREGVYLAASNRLRRQLVTFDTEMEGYIPGYGDVIYLNHDLLGAGAQFSGRIVRVDGQILTLSRDVDLTAGKVWYMGLRNEYGEPVGPLRVEQGSVPHRINLLDQLPAGMTIVTDYDRERTHFMIGEGSKWARPVKVTGIRPANDDTITITGVIEADAVHDADQGQVPPPLPDIPLPSGPGKVTGLLAAQGGTKEKPVIFLSWNTVANADRYHVELSDDGRQTWQPKPVAYVPETSIESQPGPVTIRVAAVAATRGEWTYLDLVAGGDFATPGNVSPVLSEPFTGDALKVQWDAVAGAARYLLEVHSGGQLRRSLYLLHTITRYEYSYLDAIQDAADRTLTVKVKAVNANNEQSPEWGVVSATNPAPAIPDNVVISPVVDGFMITCADPMLTDLKELRVWGSQDNEFTPTGDTVLATSQGTSVTLSAEGKWFFRLAWVDIWGLSNTSISGQYEADSAMVGADKISVNELSAISANLGTATAGTFKTNAAVGKRVEISSEGKYPIWVGQGEKTEENARLYYDQDADSLVVKGVINATSGHLENVKVSGEVEATSIKAGTVDVIDTLMIQKDSVVIPLAISRNDLVTFSANSWTDLLRVTGEDLGERIFITAGCVFAGRRVNGPMNAHIRILHNGNVIRETVPLIGPGIDTAFGNYYTQIHDQISTSLTVFGDFSGMNQFELQFRANGTDAFAYGGNRVASGVYEAHINIMSVKR